MRKIYSLKRSHRMPIIKRRYAFVSVLYTVEGSSRRSITKTIYVYFQDRSFF